MCLLPLLFRFFELDLVNFNSEFWVREGEVGSEGVGGVDCFISFAAGIDGEDTVLGKGERLKGSGELGGGEVGGCEELGEGLGGGITGEKEEDDGLEGGEEELLFAL